MAKLASYDALWIVYPDYINFPDPKDVKDLVGGAVNAAWIANTCAIRMSRALNYTGNPLPANFKGMTTVKGGDGYRYAFRVREMRNWLTFILGAVDFEINKTAGTNFDKSKISSLKALSHSTLPLRMQPATSTYGTAPPLLPKTT